MKLAILATFIAQAAPVTDPLAGGAGWATGGLIGMALLWVLKQNKELIETHSQERKETLATYSKDRETDRAALQEAVAAFKSTIENIDKQHRVDAIADREAFVARNTRLEDAIRIQTAELRAAIQSAQCRWLLEHHPKPTGG